MAYGVRHAKLAPAQLLCVLAVALLLIAGLLHLRTTYGDQLPDRSLVMSQGLTGANDTYQLNFSLTHSQTLGSIQLQFCSESPVLGTPCTKPTGFDAGSVVLSNQAGETGFAISPLSDSNTVILYRMPASVTAATNLGYTLSGITDPSAAGTFYARLQTFASTDASGTSTDDGGLALDINQAVNVSATVPPYLYFCVGISISNQDCSTTTGDYINFGNFSTVSAATAETQMVAATNGPTGYAITANGTTLTSGINTIPSLATADVSRPGTSQFGFNLRANSDPSVGSDPSGAGTGSPATGYNTPNQYKFVPGDVVASSAVPDYTREYTTSYVANIAKSQEPGVYVSTLTYVATAGF